MSEDNDRDLSTGAGDLSSTQQGCGVVEGGVGDVVKEVEGRVGDMVSEVEGGGGDMVSEVEGGGGGVVSGKEGVSGDTVRGSEDGEGRGGEEHEEEEGRGGEQVGGEEASGFVPGSAGEEEGTEIEEKKGGEGGEEEGEKGHVTKMEGRESNEVAEVIKGEEVREGGGGGEERGEGSPANKEERKAYKSQLLESAGIQLQGSSDTSGQHSQDRNIEQFSEILLDSDVSPSNSETQLSLPEGAPDEPPSGPVGEGEDGKNKPERRVRFADEVVESTDTGRNAPQSHPSSRPGSLPTGPEAETGSPKHPGTPVSPSMTSPRIQSPRSPSAPHTPDEIIAGVSYSAEYMGSTPIMLTGNASAKSARMQQAQQVVKLFKDPENDILPRFPVTVRISSQCIKIIDSTAGVDLMDHPLYTISYVADIENVLVIMINRIMPPSPAEPPQGGCTLEVGDPGRGGEGDSEEMKDEDRNESIGRTKEKNEGVVDRVEVREGVKEDGSDDPEKTGEGTRKGLTEEVEEGEEDEGYNGAHIGPIPRMICHVLETKDARHVAMVIGQAFSVAYKEFLRATGISEAALEQAEYAHVLNAQSAPQAELDLLRDRKKSRKLSLAKRKGDILGIMVMESGYGSALPTPVIAHLSKTGSATRSGQLNVGDHIIAINDINLVGMPVKVCIEQLKKCRYQNLVKMTVVSCPTVVDITIVRPDLKFQLGFTIQDGVVRSLTRGSIAERSGVRVGHYIIEINGTSTVGLTHKDLVHLLTTTVGDLHLKTMPHLMYKLITGQIVPLYH